MADEWKNYGETTFADFGTVGETQPVDAGSGSFTDFSTVPEGYNGGEKTEPATPGWQPDNAGWMDDTTQKTMPVTEGILNKEGMMVHPTTGWLVCIEGATKGQDYRLRSGYNYLGRGKDNQVAIPDMKISSKASARILYDNETRSFHINECDGASNPVYLNGKLFDHRVELQPYDVIKLGDTKLMFVPLCTEKFSWEE